MDCADHAALACCAAGSPEFFKICQDQTYALCAVASCYVYNQVAYCACDTGTILPVGSPSGAARILSVLLNGPPAPDFNRCPSPRHGG